MFHSLRPTPPYNWRHPWKQRVDGTSGGESGLSKAAEAPAPASRTHRQPQRARGSSRARSRAGRVARGASNVLLGRARAPAEKPHLRSLIQRAPRHRSGTPKRAPGGTCLPGMPRAQRQHAVLLRPGRTHQAVSSDPKAAQGGVGAGPAVLTECLKHTCLAPRERRVPQSARPGTRSQPHRGPATEAGTQRLGCRP